jgi:hypothetical protein
VGFSRDEGSPKFQNVPLGLGAKDTKKVHLPLRGGEESPQQWVLGKNGSLRAGFLAAVAANAKVIVVGGRPGTVTLAPVHSFGIDRTHLDA